MPSLRERIRGCWPGEIHWDCPLARYSTLRVGGPADALIEPAGRTELARLVSRLNENGIPWLVIGRGSNILAADRGVAGVVIVLGRHFSALDWAGTVEAPGCLVEAGCSLPRLLAWCARHGISGLEFLAGIPGTVGGAIMMNAGAFGGEISQVLRLAELLDGAGRIETRRLSAEDFCYRGWREPHHKVVVAGLFTGRADEPREIVRRCQDYVRRRRAKQPKAVASAGSFFKNPPGEAAGRLIEQAGLKGLTVGGAQVSPAHANFLVNRGQATAYDFWRLMRLVQGLVEGRCGIRLEPEVRFVGRWDGLEDQPAILE